MRARVCGSSPTTRPRSECSRVTLDVQAHRVLVHRERRSGAQGLPISYREERRLLRCEGPPALQRRLSTPHPVRADLVALQHAPDASDLARGDAAQRRRLRRIVGNAGLRRLLRQRSNGLATAEPSGNLVTIRHAGGLTTGYAHLSRFAPHSAQGQSGRNEAAHRLRRLDRALDRPAPAFQRQEERGLHRSAHAQARRRPRAAQTERPAFEEQRAALDKMIDAIPLPPLPPKPWDSQAEGDEAKSSNRSRKGRSRSRGQPPARCRR